MRIDLHKSGRDGEGDAKILKERLLEEKESGVDVARKVEAVGDEVRSDEYFEEGDGEWF